MKDSRIAEKYLEDNQLQVFFSDLASGEFPGSKYGETATARLYYKHLEDGREFIVKHFNAQEFFETELRAFVNLHSTSRICEIVFDSTKLREYWEPGFSGPYFIVKPYFKELLSSEKNIFQLIDFAAQEVDISEVFLNVGWRDFDGNFHNDAVDANGRLLRFDLDGAQPCWVPLRKFDPVFRAPHERDIRERIQEAFDELKSPQTEIRALALRLSRLLLNNLSTPWKLANDITSSHAALSSARCEVSDKATFFNRYLAPIWNRTRSRSKVQRLTENSQRLRSDWLDLWLNKFGNRTGQPRPLTSDETRFLGSIFYHLLQGDEPTFTLRDFYYSLILILAGILRQRSITFEKEKINSRLNELAELKHFISTHIGRDLDAGQRDSHQRNASPSRESQLFFAGGYWGASRSKVQGWECEDLVLDYSTSGLPMFVLADGASGAEGLTAVKIVRDVCEAFVGELAPIDSVKRAKEVLANLISRIQQTLMLEGSHGGKTYETTLVIIALCVKAKTTPVALLTRFGNSEWIATYEDQNGGIEVYNNTLRSTLPLGVRRYSFNPENDILQLPLSRLGTYRLRAFSDGIPKESIEERSQITASQDIETLVSEAAEWDKRSKLIGDDDWSLAGFDVVVEEVSHEIVITPPTPFQLDWLEQLLKLEPKHFPLSENALAFWRQALRSDSHLHQLDKYPLIEDVVGVLPRDNSGDAGITEPSANEFLKRVSDIWLKRKPWVAATVILIAVVSVIFYFALSSPRDGSLTENFNINSSTSRQSEQLPERQPDFKTAQQNQIYSILSKGNDYELSGLPRGSALDDNLNKLILDLTEVLAATSWSVIVEVHTDQTGSAQGNLLISQRRANAIAAQLLKTNRVKVSQLRVVGMGQARPSIQTERGESDQARNRRLIIIRS